MIVFILSTFMLFIIIGSCAYLILCADPYGDGIMSKLHRFIYKNSTSILDKLGINKNSKISRGCSAMSTYFFETNHPLVMYFYIFIAFGGYVLFVFTAL